MADIKVKLVTGQVGLVDESEFDPQNMVRLDAPASPSANMSTESGPVVAPPPTPQAPRDMQIKEPGLLGFAGDLLGGAGDVFRQAGTALGYKMNGDKAQKGIQSGFKNSRALIERAQREKDPNKKRQLLQASRDIDQGLSGASRELTGTIESELQNPVNPATAGIKTATGVAPWLMGMGGSLPQVLIKGAGAGGLAGLSEVDNFSDPREIATKVGGGGAGGAMGAGAFKLGGKLLSKSAGSIADSIALKTHRFNRSQIGKFFENTGEDIGDFVRKNKLFQRGTDQIDELITPTQKAYDDLALDAGTPIKVSSYLKVMDDKISELRKVANSKVQALADRLENERDLFAQLYRKKKEVGIDEITNLRRTTDDLIPDSKFNGDEISQGADRILRGVQKKVIDTATGGKTAQLGSDLEKLYAFRDIANIQKDLGRGNLPAGLTQILGAGFGAAAGGAGGYATGQDITSTLKGALIGAGFVYAANNPRILSGLIKVLDKAAKGSEKTQAVFNKVGQIAGEELGMGVASTTLPKISVGGEQPNTYPEQNQTNNQQYHNEPYNTPTTPESQIAPTKTLNPWGVSAQELGRAWQMALAAGEKGDAAILKQLYDAELEHQKLNKGTEKPLSGKNRVDFEKAQTAIRAIDRIETAINDNPNISWEKKNPFDQSGRAFGADITSAIDIIGFFRTGATLTPDQRKDYYYMFPGPLDNKATAKKKMEAIRAELEGYQKLGNSELTNQQFDLPEITTQQAY